MFITSFITEVTVTHIAIWIEFEPNRVLLPLGSLASQRKVYIPYNYKQIISILFLAHQSLELKI